MIQSFNKIRRVSGQLKLPGDKSIAHRALIISSMADGESIIENLPFSEDIQSTINCLRQLGVEIIVKKEQAIIKGRGYNGFKKPAESLYAGNSGTTARLLAGVLVAQDFESQITGDESLLRRPMKRVINPLLQMGADIHCSPDGTLPLLIKPVNKLKSLDYMLPVASAQVKSAVLLAGLYSKENTKVIETIRTRDHTERLLGLNSFIDKENCVTIVSKSNYPVPRKYFIPSDVSTGAYFVLPTLLSKNSELILQNISVNPTRIAYLKLLRDMGANITINEKGASCNEPYGDILVFSSKLQNIEIDNNKIPAIIDEIPILAVAGVLAEGRFELKNASELRVKESDRITSLCSNFLELSLEVKEYNDGFSVSGAIKNAKPVFNSFGDHRIAMAFGALCCLLENGGSVDGYEAVNVSNPDFLIQLKKISAQTKL